jgi:initiation factor 1A
MGGKNIHGGAGHKKFARKHNAGGSKNNRLKVAENEYEIYGIATNMLGNNMFHCHCIDNVIRLCHIRGKFTGRSKRDNMVESGKWVLVGLRDWTDSKTENDNKKMQHSDLLEVYSEMDKHRLKECVNANWSVLENNDVTRDLCGTNEIEPGFVFGTDQDFERDKLIEEMQSSSAQRITFNVDNEMNDEIDINDI